MHARWRKLGFRHQEAAQEDAQAQAQEDAEEDSLAAQGARVGIVLVSARAMPRQEPVRRGQTGSISLSRA
jgi:hypothetical protein